MEAIYSKAFGVDVHKSLIVAVICDLTGPTPNIQKRFFSIFNNSLIQLRNWLIESNCQNVCMESTGKYYIPVYNGLQTYLS